VALNNEELHALLRLRGQLNIQEPPRQTEETSERPQTIPTPMPSLQLFLKDASGQQVPVMKHGKDALEPLKELNPKMDTVLDFPVGQLTLPNLRRK